MVRRPTPGDTDTGQVGRPLRLAALVVGIAFLAVGVLGFVPGVTADFDQLRFAGYKSTARLLGLFEVSVLHNVVHLAFGVAGLAAARRNGSAQLYLILGGLLYALVWLYGLVIDEQSAANVLPVNTADNWLHLGLAVGMIGLGAALSVKTQQRGPRGQTARAAGDGDPPSG